MTHGLDFRTQKFPHDVIYSYYRLEEENTYMPIFIYVIFWISYVMFVEAASLE